MKFLRSSSLVLTSLAIVACADDKGSVTPSSGNVVAASVSAGQGGDGGGATTGNGGAPGAGGETAQSSASTGGGDQASTASTAAGQGGAGGSGGAGGDGGAGGGGGLPFSCINDELDDGETDVDCGGDLCPPCEAEQTCEGPEDCLDSICAEQTCVLGSCDDDVTNQDETDDDCGGLTCLPCGFGQECLVGGDCDEGVCTGGFCATPSCSDDVTNGDETGLDCGADCEPCEAGQGCIEPEDCLSGVCTLDVCQEATCDDGVTNGGESDIDCGGNGCSDCGAGKACNADGNCVSNDCSNAGVCLCPSGMTTVPIPGGGSYCIDPTEVTYAEYNTFLTANPPFNVEECEFNIGGYTPTDLWPPSDSSLADNYVRRPVRYVDWCDAAAYCNYLGKRLCGAIAGGASTDLTSPTEDQWFNACTASGTNTFPYSGGFNGAACTESVDGAAGLPVAVREGNGAIVETCEGGFSDIHQMSGNIAEWGDACTPSGEGGGGGAMPQDDDCVVRGGSYLSQTSAAVQCTATQTFDRSFKSADIGIRCCQ